MKERGRRFRPGMLLAAALSLASTSARADGTKEQCIDANARAQDLRREGRLSAASEKLRACASASCPAIVRDDCTRRLDELEKAQPTVIFEARDGAGNDVGAVKVTVDGLLFAERLGGTPLPVDPGEHTFTFESPGQPAQQKKLVLRENEKGRRERITFGAPSGAPGTEETSGGRGTQKNLAIVAASVGVVGLGIGGVFGLLAISKRNDAQNACPGQCADPSGVGKWSDAKSAGNVSTVAFIVGGVALAGGAVLWFTAAPESSKGPSARLGAGPGSVQLVGTW